MYLNSWFPAVGTAWQGLGGLLKKGAGFEFSNDSCSVAMDGHLKTQLFLPSAIMN